MRWSRRRFHLGLCIGIIAVLAWQYAPRPAPKLPPPEAAFVAVVEDARTAWINAPNDLARIDMRAARAQKLCAVLPGLTASHWRAVVQSITPNTLPDFAGKATARIILLLPPDITLSTPASPLFNNSAAMVEAGSPLYAIAATLRPGTVVRFSAIFPANGTDCIDEESFTPNGSMTAPQFKMQLLSLQRD
jgi:hypothetical protein